MKARHFLYFVPGLTMVTEEKRGSLPERLRALLPDSRYTSVHTMSGPGKTSGALFCALPDGIPETVGDESNMPELGYQPDKQTWREAFHAEGDNPPWCVGYWNDRKPEPEDLARARQVPGYAVELEYGEWVVPMVRKADGGSLLPQRLRRDNAGKLVQEPLQAHEWLVARGLALFNAMDAVFRSGGEVAEFTYESQLEVAEAALGINYHAGPEEFDLLGVWTTQNVGAVNAYMIDLPTLRDKWVSEKNELAGDGSSTDSGSTD